MGFTRVLSHPFQVLLAVAVLFLLASGFADAGEPLTAQDFTLLGIWEVESISMANPNIRSHGELTLHNVDGHFEGQLVTIVTDGFRTERRVLHAAAEVTEFPGVRIRYYNNPGETWVLSLIHI